MSLFLGFCVAFLWHQSDNRGERAGEIERARGVNPKRGKREREREVFFFHEVVERLLDLSSSLFFFLRVFLFAQSFLFCFVDLSVSFLLSSYSSSVAKRQSGVERGGGREEACCCSGYFQRKRAKKFPLFFLAHFFLSSSCSSPPFRSLPSLPPSSAAEAAPPLPPLSARHGFRSHPNHAGACGQAHLCRSPRDDEEVIFAVCRHSAAPRRLDARRRLPARVAAGRPPSALFFLLGKQRDDCCFRSLGGFTRKRGAEGPAAAKQKKNVCHLLSKKNKSRKSFQWRVHLETHLAARAAPCSAPSATSSKPLERRRHRSDRACKFRMGIEQRKAQNRGSEETQ